MYNCYRGPHRAGLPESYCRKNMSQWSPAPITFSSSWWLHSRLENDRNQIYLGRIEMAENRPQPIFGCYSPISAERDWTDDQLGNKSSQQNWAVSEQGSRVWRRARTSNSLNRVARCSSWTRELKQVTSGSPSVCFSRNKALSANTGCLDWYRVFRPRQLMPGNLTRSFSAPMLAEMYLLEQKYIGFRSHAICDICFVNNVSRRHPEVLHLCAERLKRPRPNFAWCSLAKSALQPNSSTPSIISPPFLNVTLLS